MTAQAALKEADIIEDLSREAEKLLDEDDSKKDLKEKRGSSNKPCMMARINLSTSYRKGSTFSKLEVIFCVFLAENNFVNELSCLSG
jgi:hypothetical protein